MGTKSITSIARLAVATSFAMIAWICLAGSSKAADWTGCYVGAHVGMSSTVTTADFGGFATIDGFGTEGAAGGITAGCDKQIDKVVVGVWGDYTWHDQEFSISSPYVGALAALSLDDQWSIGGRAGYLVTPDALVYGLVGYTRASYGSLTSPAFGASMSVPDFAGIIVGGGAELALGSGWSMDARYTYTKLDSETVDIGGFPLGLDPSIHTVRVGAAYRFNFDLTR